MDTTYIFIFQIFVLLSSVIVHEVSHGIMALRLGDETAKNAGRLTLNPISHLDPIGSILLPVILIVTGSPIIFGWAKPVPYNPRNLYKDYKYGPLKVALAGPASNLAVATIFGLLIRFAGPLLGSVTVGLLGFVVFLNILLAVFNLLPIPPLDGSKVLITFLPRNLAFKVERMGLMGMLFVLLFLFLFLGVITGITFLLFNLLVGPAAAEAFLNFFGAV